MQKNKALWGSSVFLAGVMSVFSFAPFYFFPAIWLSLTIFLLSILRAPYAKAAGLYGFLYGLGFFLANIHWIYISLHDYGEMPAIFAIIALLIFSSYLALFPMMAGYLSYKLPCTFSVRLLILFPVVWILCEWLRGTLLTGFPWALIGYTHIPDTPLAGFAPILGVYGVSFLVIISVALMVWGCMLTRRHLIYALVIVGSLWAGGVGLRGIEWTKSCGKPLTVSLVQGNIAQSLKWQPELFWQTLNTYQSLIQRSPGELILLPETAIPAFLSFLPQFVIDQLQSASKNRALITGIPSLDEKTNQYYNSAVLLTDSHLPIYHKSHLVPFGEYIPWPFFTRWVIDSLNIPLTDFSRGPALQLPFKVKDQFIAMNVCYEDIFGAEIANNAKSATILANISNLAWFDGSIAMAQHGQMAQARALETGRPMLRATNTGLTAMITHHGLFMLKAAIEEEVVLTKSIQGRCGYTPYLHIKDAGILLILLILFGLALFLSWRHKNQART